MIEARSSFKTTPTRFTILAFQLVLILCFGAEARCRHGCDLAVASYYVGEASNLSYISNLFNQQVPKVRRYNPGVSEGEAIAVGTRVNVPFPCDCLNGDFLGHTFAYVTRWDGTYSNVAMFRYFNLTTAGYISRVNEYDPHDIPDGVLINVTVNCTCGERRVSRSYGAFMTYPLRPGDNLSELTAEAGVPAPLLELYKNKFLGIHFDGTT